jgi:hypothetical protein
LEERANHPATVGVITLRAIYGQATTNTATVSVRPPREQELILSSDEICRKQIVGLLPVFVMNQFD